MSSLELKIVADNRMNWVNHPTYINARQNEDVGLDIPMPFTLTVPPKVKAYIIDLGFKAEQTHGYMLIPRSSISKTTLRLSNSIGIIDKNYRGKVLVKVDNISSKPVILNEDSCYFQIISFNGVLPDYQLVTKINNTSRGIGGFGSTTQ